MYRIYFEYLNIILMKIVCIITARKNSRRLKNKNLKKLGSKKLVEWSIDMALSMKNFFSDIIITSDCPHILKIGKRNKIISIRRSKKLSTAKSKSEDVIIDAIKKYDKNFDIIILFQPTSPFRSKKAIHSAVDFFIKKKLDNIYSFSFEKKIHKQKILNSKIYNLKPNGNFYVSRFNFFKNKKSFFLGKCFGYGLDQKKLCIDIDYKTDFDLAKNLIK